jgi:phosphatidylinositol alpha-1,6-mannosyltransferase
MTITEIMIRERPQVVQLATAYEGHLGLWLRQWLKLPYIVYAYGNEILDVMRSTGYQKPRIALQKADRVVAISQFTANLLEEAGVVPDKIEIVYPGCDVNNFRPLPSRMDLRQKLLGSRHRDRIILTVGNLVARKGHDMVIRALPRVCQRVPDTTYLIVGDGPYRAELEKLAMSIGVRDRVIFAGMIPNEDLAPIYALCDVFAMPSRDQSEQCDVEGFGVVFLEASSCGKPVMGGRSGGIPEAVADGVTGLLVDPHDPEDIANAITRLLLDSDLSTRLGRQGRLRVARDFTWERVGTQVQGILESILQEESPRS